MALRICRMLQVLVTDEFKDPHYPIAEAIVIVPHVRGKGIPKKWKRYGEQELKPYIDLLKYPSETKDLGWIRFPPPVPTTIFLYTRTAGRIK